MINYFEILSVSERAEKEVIHAAYRGLAKKYHPDTTKLPKEIAEKKMADINEAYRVLSDDKLRGKHLQEIRCGTCQSETVHTESCFKQETNANEKERHAYETTEEGYGIGFYVIVGAIIVSIICCFVYFVPELLSNAWNNIQSGIREILSTF